MLRWTAIIFLWLAGAGLATAEDMPYQQPLLRVEAGMHTDIIRHIDVSADGRLLVTASADKTARLWSLPDGKLLRTLRVPIGPGQGGDVYAVAISPDGRLIAVGGWDAHGDAVAGEYFVHVFDAVNGSLTYRLEDSTSRRMRAKSSSVSALRIPILGFSILRA